MRLEIIPLDPGPNTDATEVSRLTGMRKSPSPARPEASGDSLFLSRGEADEVGGWADVPKRAVAGESWDQVSVTDVSDATVTEVSHVAPKGAGESWDQVSVADVPVHADGLWWGI